MHGFQARAYLALREVLATRVQTLTQGLCRQLQERRWVCAQVSAEQLVAVAGVPGQGQHQAQVGARRAEHAGNMQQRLAGLQVDHRRNRLLAAMTEQVVV
jgi:ABC-type uncharacterized transport system ATPase subunit